MSISAVSQTSVFGRERDTATDEALGAAGWTVLRFWEHEPPETVAEAVRVRVADAQPRTWRD